MFAYSSVAQIGYITLGIGIANAGRPDRRPRPYRQPCADEGGAVHGARRHLLPRQHLQIEELAGIGRKMPLTMAAFTIAGLGLVGMPGTVGFVSKWYLVVARFEQRLVVAGLPHRRQLADHLVYVGRVLEVVWLREPSQAIAQASDPPLSMLLPLLVLAAATVYFGIDTQWSAGIAATRGQSPARGTASVTVPSPDKLVMLAVVTPFIGALIIPLFHKTPNLRETVTLITAAALCFFVFSLLGPVLGGARPELPGVQVAARSGHRFQGRAARHVVRAGRLGIVGRQFDLLDRLHAGPPRATPDGLLRLLRFGDRQRRRHRLRQEPVHAVSVLRSSDSLDLSAGHAPRRRGGDARRPHLSL